MKDKDKLIIVNSEKKPIKLNFEEIASPDNLKSAWYQLKSNPGMLTYGTSTETLNKIDDSWFKKISAKLINGTLKYPMCRRKNIPKPSSKNNTRPITIINPRIKIIEKAFLNSLEPLFEGSWSWSEVSKNKYEKLKKDSNIPDNDVKSNKNGCFVKSWLHKPIFNSVSYGFRPNKFCHQALFSIKHWKTNTV